MFFILAVLRRDVKRVARPNAAAKRLGSTPPKIYRGGGDTVSEMSGSENEPKTFRSKSVVCSHCATRRNLSTNVD